MDSRYSIRQMVDLTGLSEFTLRGWELRYHAFQPSRTQTQRRMYSSQDLQKALLLRELTQRHHRIGDIASLHPMELRHLLGTQISVNSSANHIIHPEVTDILKATALQNWPHIEASLLKVVRKMKPLVALREVILPVFDQIAIEVEEGRLSIAQEHILSALFRQSLHSMVRPKRKKSKTKIIVAAPEGDFHEIGILIAHVMVHQYDFHSLLVGCNTPKDQLSETAHRYGATHVLIGSTLTRDEGARENFFEFMNFLDRHLSPSVSIWYGGRATHSISLKRKTLWLKNLEELDQKLQKI